MNTPRNASRLSHMLSLSTPAARPSDLNPTKAPPSTLKMVWLSARRL